jgi:hypothetical protein
MKYRLSPRVALLIIAALFFLPLVLAWLMHSGTIEFRPHSTRNFGQLVHPPLPLTWAGVYPDSSMDGPHAVPQPCDEDCLRDIADLRQVHRAAGRQQSRIRLALLLETEGRDEARVLQDIYGAFQLLRDPDGSLWLALERVASQSESAAPARGSTYLIDPLGNIMLFYAAGYDPNDLKNDLKRLLTWSKLDE